MFFFGLVCSGWNFVKTFRQLFRVQCVTRKEEAKNLFKAKIEGFTKNIHVLCFFCLWLISIRNKKWPKTVPDKSIKTLPIIKIMSKQLKTKDGLAAVGFLAPDCK